jgi:hypothetical protein
MLVCGVVGAGVEPSPSLAAAKPAEAPTAEECLACHADRDLKRDKPARGQVASVFVDGEAVKASRHAGLACVGCHVDATAPHERLAKVRCAGCHADVEEATAAGVHDTRPGRSSPATVTCAGCHGVHDVGPPTSLSPGLCARCHAEQVRLYQGSVHGRSRRQGNSEAATCGSCHGAAHGVLTKRSEQSPTYHLNLPRTCAQCHGDPELAKRHKIPVTNAYQLYMDSLHGRALTRSGLLVAANCSDCHGAHDIQPRTEPTSRVFPANVPKTCGACHAGILAAYDKSVHGRALARGDAAPVCVDCHSAHEIRRVEGTSWTRDVVRECGTCHEESLRTYRDTFHGKVTTLGFARAAKCADCHGAHDILPVSDPGSRVSGANVVSTCRKCHADATFSFAQFQPHADPHDRARFPGLYYTYVAMTALLIGTFAFFGVHTALWLPRSFIERLRRRRTAPGDKAQ